ncbi:MAG: hypothetical protein H0V11_01110 [Actinobacteria bacterium]|nr:hypothetical protein [Actinomycetota bacterium]
MSRSRQAIEYVAAFAAALAVSVYVTWPLTMHLGDRIYGLPGDSTGTIAFLWLLDEKIGYPVVGETHMTLTGTPFGWDFANAINAQWALVFAPGWLLTKLVGEIPAYDLLVIGGLAASGFAMYWLIRRLGASILVAAWAGLVYLIFPWHLEKAQGHVGFVWLEGFPLLLAAVVAWSDQPGWRRALLIGGASAVLWTTNGYFGILGTVMLGVMLAAAVVLRRARLGAGVVALGAALIAPIALLLLSLGGPVDQGISVARSEGELSTYGARWWEYVLPSYRNPVFGDDVGPYLVDRLHGSNFSESTLYVGWLTIVLAIGWIVWAIRRRKQLDGQARLLLLSLPAVILVAVLFSLPSPLPGTGITMPSEAIWRFVPQFRVPSRFVVIVLTALLPLAAFGLEGLRRRAAALPGPPRLAKAVSFAVCVVAFAVSSLELAIDPEPATADVGSAPSLYRAVRAAPPGALVEYPLVRSDQGVNSEYLFWQRIHERALVNGAQLGTFADRVGQTLIDPVSPETAPSLAALGVSTIVVRANTYAFSGTREGPQDVGPGYRLIGRFPVDTSLWRVVAKRAPAIATFAAGFSHAESLVGQPTSRWMIASDADVLIYTWRPGTYEAEFLLSSYGRARVVRVRGRNSSELFGVGAPRRVKVRVRLPRGHSILRLSARPGPERVPDGRSVTVYVSNWRFVPASRRGPGVLEPFAGEK